MGYQQDVFGFATATVAGTAPTTVLVATDGVVAVPDLLAMLQGDYLRAGPDLVLVAPDGARTIIRDFFATETPPDLVSADGAVVSGALATRLAGPVAPGQTAQAGGDVVTDAQLAQADQPIGTIEAVKGTVTIIRADGTQVTAQVGDPVFADDIVQTANGSSLGLRFIDDTEFSLGANGRMVLDEMVFDPASGDGSASFNLLAGTFSFVSGQLAKAGPDAVKVVTPVATIGIRGTSGSIGVGAGGDGAELKIVLVPDANGSVGEIQVTTPSGQTFSLNLPMGALRMAGGTIQTFTMSKQEFNQSFGDSLSALPSGGQLLNRINEVAQPTPADTPEGETFQDGGPGDGNQGDGIQGDGIQGDGNQGEGNQGEGKQGEGEGLPENVPPPPPLPELPPLPKPLPPPPARPVPPVQTPAPTVAPKPTPEPTPEPTSEPTPGPTPEPEEQEGSASGSTVFDKSHSTSDWTVKGDDGGNTIFTGSGNDTVSTGTGDDLIMTGAGNDTVSAGAGSDYIIGGSGEGDDIYDGGDGVDVVSYASTDEGITVYLQGAPGHPDAGMATGPEIGTDVLTGIEHVYGGYGNDTIIGNAADNRLYSWAGDNLLNGGAGNDYLYGGDGNNTLIGGTGNDILEGGTGANLMTDESGSNTFIGNGGAADTMVGGTGNDTYVLHGIGAVTITDTGGSDSLYITNWTTPGSFTRSGDDLVLSTGSVTATLVNAFAGGTSIETIETQDAFYVMPVYTGATILAGTYNNDILLGTAGNDTFTGSAGNDYIAGSTGSDGLSYAATTQGVTVYLQGASGYEAEGRAAGLDIGTDRLLGIENVTGGSGDDAIIGNADANTLFGGTGNDSLYGGGGNDTLIGGDGADMLSGGTGNDSLSGGAGDDTLFGGAGSNVLTAASGNNTFIGDGGTDTMTGGAGDDTYKVAATGTATITDTGGADTLDVTAWGASQAVFTRVGDNLLISKGTAASTTTVTLVNAFAGGTSIESVVTAGGTYALAIGGGAGTVVGTGADDILLGTNGNDAFAGSVGNDYIDGGLGSDVVDYATTTDGVSVVLKGAVGYAGDGWATGLEIGTDRLLGIENVIGGAGDDALVGNADANTLSGGAGNDVLYGGMGNDTLLGNDGADTLYGEAGNDSLAGGAGNDTLYGGAGSNVLTAASGDNAFIGEGGTDTMTGGAGNDTYTVAATGMATITDTGGADSLDLSAWGAATPIFSRVGDNLLISNGTTAPTATATLVNVFAGGTSIESVVTAGGTYTVTVGSGAATIAGTGADDILLGTTGNDVFTGSAGNDYIDGGSGTDALSYATATNGLSISLQGASGYAAEGRAIGLGIGTDRLVGIENVTGGSGDDVVYGNADANTVSGGAGDDLLYGGAGDDTLLGNDGADLLYGQAGNDSLSGGAGNDTLYGGAGSNVLTAASGDNTFIGEGGTDTMTGGAGNDTYKVAATGTATITDTGGADILDLSAWTAAPTFTRVGDNLLASNGTATATVINAYANGTSLESVLSASGVTFAVKVGTGGSLIGTGGNDILLGSNGADILIGGASNDYLGGGAGIDTADYSSTLYGVRVGLTGAEGYAAQGAAMGSEIGIDGLVDIENVIGGSGDDTIFGNADANTLSGGAGNDTLYGGAGANVLTAASGNNTFVGEGGTDTMIGGAGNDTYTLANTGAATIADSGGTDTLDVIAWGLTASTFTRVGDDLLVSNGSATATLVNAFAGGTSIETVVAAVGTYAVTVGSGADAIVGTSANDILLGTTGDDVFVGSAGNDYIDGGAGSDTVAYDTATSGLTIGLTGAEGYASEGRASGSSIGTNRLVNIENVSGGSGNDTLIGNDSANILKGGDGNDALTGGGGNDALYGGTGTNILSAASGDNTFYGQGGTDSMTGGVGNDTYIMDVTGTALIATGGGTDVLDLTAWGNAYIIGRDGTNLTLSSGSGASVTVTDHFGSGALGLIRTSTGNLTVAAGLIGGPDSEIIIGTTGDDIITTGEGANFVNAGAGNDTVTGGSGDDILIGGAGIDVLDGGAGNDLLVGNVGDNALYGGDGNDTYVIGTGDIMILDTSGSDVVDIGDLPEDDAVFLRRAVDDLKIVGQNDAYMTTIVGHFAGNRIEQIWEPAYEIMNNLLDGVVGTADNDIFTVSSVNFNYAGMTYWDTINGGDGDDVFFLEGNGGYLTVFGGAGKDEFVMDPTATSAAPWGVIDGGDGFDIVTLHGGADYTAGSEAGNITNVEEVRFVGTGAVAVTAYLLPSVLNLDVEGNIETIDVYGSYMDNYDIDVSQWTFVNGTSAQLLLWGYGGYDPQTITGSNYRDVIFADYGTASVSAGAGDDSVVVLGTYYNWDEVNPEVYAFYDGGAGTNALRFDHVGSPTDVDVFLSDGYGWAGDEFGFTNFQNVFGSAGSDTIRGDANDNILSGGQGGMYDFLYGDDGNDTLYAGFEGGTLEGGGGDDVLYGTEAGAVEFAFSGEEFSPTPLSDLGTDTIHNWKSTDTLFFEQVYTAPDESSTQIFDGWDWDGDPYTRYIEIGDLADSERTFTSTKGGFVSKQNGADVEVWYTEGTSTEFLAGTGTSYQIALLTNTDLSQISASNFMPDGAGQEQIPW